jgi:UDP-N-acetylmuramate dehydrogenase
VLIKYNEPLANHTTFKIGGPARRLLFPESRAEFLDTLRDCPDALILGKGSNVLAPDGGVDKDVISTLLYNEITLDGNAVTAACGATLATLANFAAENSLSGLEFASGIPGTVGGAVRMNAGAYGGEMSQTVSSVEVYSKGEVLTVADSGFSYRHSRYVDSGEVILSVTLTLTPGVTSEIIALQQEYNRRRRDKQPLEYPSAGSSFKRPQGHYAAELIDRAACKGLQIGKAQVSEKHAGFIVNLGGASASDVEALMALVSERVFEQSGLVLEPEVVRL